MLYNTIVDFKAGGYQVYILFTEYGVLTWHFEIIVSSITWVA